MHGANVPGATLEEKMGVEREFSSKIFMKH
jgi:hypothetical protein